MLFVGLRQIYNRQNHEDKRLQRDYQNMEDCPGYVQYPLRVERQQCNQNKYHLTGVHVTEQTQCQRQRLGQQAKDLQERSEEHTSELQSRENLVCRLLLEKKKRS